MSESRLPVSARGRHPSTNDRTEPAWTFELGDQSEGSIFVAAVRLKLRARSLAIGGQLRRPLGLPNQPKCLPKLSPLDLLPNRSIQRI